MKSIKAIVLFSGGLDSTLAIYIAKQQGLELLALKFSSPFCLCDKKRGCSNHGSSGTLKKLGIELKTIDNTKEMLECVKRPKYGYGSGLNPCIDCRILMLKKTKQYMLGIGASFVITGEVLEQRPMSQRRHMLRLIEKESGLDGLIVRPLCAKSLEETIPEKNAWIDRKKLLNIVGRGRRQQIAVAKELGINDYPCPSGGCLLTDPNFVRRLKDLMEHTIEFSLNDILLLKLGRHFRINQECKLVVGRNEKENDALLNLVKDNDLIFMPEETIAGPTALARGKFGTQERKTAASLVSRYCDRREAPLVRIEIEDKRTQAREQLNSPPICSEKLASLII